MLLKALRTQADGVSKSMAQLRTDNVIDQMKLVGHEVEDLGISLFDLGGGPLKDVVKGTKDWVDANKELSSPTSKPSLRT